MAAQEAAESESESLQYPFPFNGLIHINGACRLEPATVWKPWRNITLVPTEQKEDERFHRRLPLAAEISRAGLFRLCAWQILCFFALALFDSFNLPPQSSHRGEEFLAQIPVYSFRAFAPGIHHEIYVVRNCSDRLAKNLPEQAFRAVSDDRRTDLARNRDTEAVVTKAILFAEEYKTPGVEF